jgi:hypothetical protein
MTVMFLRYPAPLSMGIQRSLDVLVSTVRGVVPMVGIGLSTLTVYVRTPMLQRVTGVRTYTAHPSFMLRGDTSCRATHVRVLQGHHPVLLPPQQTDALLWRDRHARAVQVQDRRPKARGQAFEARRRCEGRDGQAGAQDHRPRITSARDRRSGLALPR